MIKSHDELMKMTGAQRLAYLEQEVEAIINDAPSHMQLKLRALQAKLNGIRKSTKNNYVCALKMFLLMKESFEELRSKLNKM